MVAGQAELEARCRQAIEDLHGFFEAWLSGALPDTDEAFAPLEAALAPDFRFVRPDGHGLDRDTLVAGLRAGHSGRPGLRIWIENVRLVVVGQDLLVAEYEEWQRIGDEGSATGRCSTVVFDAPQEGEPRPDTEVSLVWRRVHETWIERG